ncbi:MAG: hypothetical protein M1819_005751 [Sarea resinae]|nr:MAG: hypothetical protein M1819_005751 [Sarea resinae]
MASTTTTAPSTPETSSVSSPPPTMRRSFTLPAKLRENKKPLAREADAEGIETLFSVSAAKIVSFTASNISRRTSAAGAAKVDVDTEAAGTLPWSSSTERTIAAGPLRIYRVPGSVAFLNSGSTLHPILIKSQCWCVDGKTKFVLRIRQNSYYRIELPNTCDDDRKKADELKSVLPHVLQYEKTECPFKREFIVELPEAPKTPVRKRPWKPPERPKAPIPERQSESESADEYLTAASGDDSSSHDGSDHENESEATDDTNLTPRNGRSHSPFITDAFEFPSRPKTAATARSVTMPFLPTDTLRSLPGDLSDSLSEAGSLGRSEKTISPLPTTPLSQDQNPLDDLSTPSALHSHQRDISEMTIRPDDPPRLWSTTTPPSEDSRSASPPPRTPTLISDAEDRPDEEWSDIVTPPQISTSLRRRPFAAGRRALSPLPLPANIFQPPTYSPGKGASGRHLTTAVIQKTCSILLGPPVHLVALMLNIASKIANGAMRGVAFGFGEKGEKIPCSWDYSDSDELSDENAVWDDEEVDDYGIALDVPASKRTSRAGSTVSRRSIASRGGSQMGDDTGNSWEID